MSTIPLQTNLSMDDLMRAVDQLPPGQLDTVLQHVLSLRARRQAGSLSATETALLQRINKGLNREQQECYQTLIDRRDARVLTQEEHAELLRLTDHVEHAEADRAAALVDLAQLRQVPVNQLLCELGIRLASQG